MSDDVFTLDQVKAFVRTSHSLDRFLENLDELHEIDPTSAREIMLEMVHFSNSWWAAHGEDGVQ